MLVTRGLFPSDAYIYLAREDLPGKRNGQRGRKIRRICCFGYKEGWGTSTMNSISIK